MRGTRWVTRRSLL